MCSIGIQIKHHITWLGPWPFKTRKDVHPLADIRPCPVWIYGRAVLAIPGVFQTTTNTLNLNFPGFIPFPFCNLLL
jgi:hypothetical protein